MPQLSKERVGEFRKMLKEEYGAEYTYEEAWEAAHNFLNFFDLLIRIDHRQKKDGKELSQ